MIPSKILREKSASRRSYFWSPFAEGEIVGTVMAGYEGRRGWINYLAVSPAQQRKGTGRRLMQEAEKRLLVLGCPKVNLLVRTSNSQVIEFYRKLGFTRDDAVSLGKRLLVDAPDQGTPMQFDPPSPGT